MKITEKYDKVPTGVISGLFLPLSTAFIIYLFAKGDPTIGEWMKRIADANIITHIITLSVFTNIAIFLLFNYFDMLKAAKGVLGITIVWALLVFGIKIF